MKKIFLLLSLYICFACSQANDSKAKQLIESCVQAHGGDAYQQFGISFDFRKYNFIIKNDSKGYQYERKTEDSLKNIIQDVIINNRFERKINDKVQVLSAKDESKFKESTNSIAYFVLLPYKLLDPAVQSEFVGTKTLEGNQYDKIKIWFKKEGGGKDHDDVFCYWINQKTHTLDYLAYDNGGPRFRKAINRQKIGGIVFQDYENYAIADSSLLTSDYDTFFAAGKAKLLSKIEQKNYVLMK
jgi:hypothetical protein